MVDCRPPIVGQERVACGDDFILYKAGGFAAWGLESHLRASCINFPL